MRAKSVSEESESRYKCNNTVGDTECNNIMTLKFNLTDIKPESDEEVSPEIQLTDTVVLKLRYPQFSVVKDSVGMESVADVTFNMIANSVEYIYDGEQFYYAKETTKEDILEFLEQLNQQQFEKIEEFFDAMPKMSKKIEMTCKKCGFRHELETEGLESFFVF